MINLHVDESFAFDYLSILMVKLKKKADEQNAKNVSVCKEHLQKQIGQELMDKILSSQEFIDLVDANELVFDLVEKARYDFPATVTAKDVDAGNMERYFAKKNLQKTFFNNELAEVKT